MGKQFDVRINPQWNEEDAYGRPDVGCQTPRRVMWATTYGMALRGLPEINSHKEVIYVGRGPVPGVRPK